LMYLQHLVGFVGNLHGCLSNGDRQPGISLMALTLNNNA
jgi:hypothetical protein